MGPEVRTAGRKLKDLRELSRVLETARAQGKKVVHCHGVFDLLHIGHIRYFEQAKKLGDVLAVTITPDVYVNKGPGRPAFNEQLRAEAIVALDCVDYVAINQWSTAVEAIRLLRPHHYVKGADYKDPEEDVTGGIALERAAIESVGGELAFTKDITFSSSNLINRHLSVLPEELNDYLRDFSSRYSADYVIGCVEGVQSLKVLVVGEAIVDDYQYCEAIGKSSKEPVLAVKSLAAERFAGGILAVGNHVANFCDHVGLITFLGAENSQEDFVRGELNADIEATFLYRRDSPTIVKRRYIENYFLTKLWEVYEINEDALHPADDELLCATLREELPKYDVVIVVDFGHSMLSGEAIDILCSKARFLAVNAQSNAGNLGYHSISKYSRADYVSLSENEIRLDARDRTGDLKCIIKDLSKQLDCARVVVTRGNRGALCYGEGEGFFDVPALTEKVVDRIGAGDAFLAVTSLCVARNTPMEAIGLIGNAVGAQAVATMGNRNPVERIPLLKGIEALLK